MVFKFPQNLGVRHLVVCGGLTDQCVESAVRDACDLGYLVTLVTDACVTYSPERHAHSLAAIRGYCRQRTTQAFVNELEEVVAATRGQGVDNARERGSYSAGKETSIATDTINKGVGDPIYTVSQQAIPTGNAAGGSSGHEQPLPFSNGLREAAAAAGKELSGKTCARVGEAPNSRSHGPSCCQHRPPSPGGAHGSHGYEHLATLAWAVTPALAVAFVAGAVTGSWLSRRVLS